MVATAYLARTLVTAVLVAGVFVLILRGRPWRHYTPQTAYSLDAGGGGPQPALSRIANSPNTWTLAYVLLVVGLLAGAVVTLTDVVPESGLIVGILVAVVVYVLVGVYYAIRSNGRSSAQAVGGSLVTLGFLVVLGISLKLILGL
jgi:hypothetical protein